MIRSLLIPMAIVAGIACAGCEDTKPATQQAPTSQAQTTPAPVAESDLAVQADFEEEAVKSITVANYKAELDSLDTEIGQAN